MAMGSGNTKADVLPALAAQDAWLAGNRVWRGRARPMLTVDYSDGREWFVVRALPSLEDRALATLGRAGFDAFLPMGKREVIHHRTKAKTERTFPLLAGYLFLAMPTAKQRQHWGLVRDCHGIQAVLGIAGCPKSLPTSEVEALRLAEAQDRLRVQRATQAFAAGEQVRIADGPFVGINAVIVDAEVGATVGLLINLMNRMTHITVPVDLLERV